MKDLLLDHKKRDDPFIKKKGKKKMDGGKKQHTRGEKHM